LISDIALDEHPRVHGEVAVLYDLAPGRVRLAETSPYLFVILRHRALTLLFSRDVFVIHSLDRLARNLDDLRSIVLGLTNQGVAVEFVKEHLTFTGDDSAMSNLLLSVMGAFAEFERALIGERQREGIALAKKAGVYKERKPSLDAERATQLRQRVASGEKKASLAREFGISPETLYQYIRA
jgi:DNA invertase Pin-like site-specific DNA recombinase